MTRETKVSTIISNVSIILGSISLFLVLANLIPGIVAHFTGHQITDQQFFLNGVVINAVVCGLIIVMLLLIKYISPLIGGIGMALLGLGGFVLAAGVKAEITSFQSLGLNPSRLDNSSPLIAGILLLAGGILAISVSKINWVFKAAAVVITLFLMAILSGGFQYHPHPTLEAPVGIPDHTVSDFMTALKKRDYTLAYTYLGATLPNKPTLEEFASYNDIPRAYWFVEGDIRNEFIASNTDEGTATVVIGIYHSDNQNPGAFFINTEEFQLQQEENGTWRITGLSQRYIPLFSSYKGV